MADTQIRDLRRKLEKHFQDTSEIFPDFTSVKKIDVVSSSSVIVDAITGIGGFPRGRMTEVFGGYSSGKTTLLTQGSASVQRINPNSTVLFVDFEHAFDASYGHALGVDLNPDRFVFCQPDYFEQGWAVIDQFVSQGLVDMVILDSAAAMTPRAELEGSVEDTGGIGLQARLMSRMLGQLTKKISRGRKPALVIANQTRMKIDTKNARNNREDSAAGSALKFYASLRLQLEIITGEGDEGRSKSVTDQLYTQNRVRVTAIKNKLAPPWMRGQITMEYGRGINNILSVAELAEQKLGIMSGSGYFKYEGDTTETSVNCRGRDAFQDIMMKSPEIYREIEGKVLARMREEHAASLGVKVLSTGESAKEITYSEEVMVIDSNSSRESLVLPSDGLPVEDIT